MAICACCSTTSHSTYLPEGRERVIRGRGARRLTSCVATGCGLRYGAGGEGIG